MLDKIISAFDEGFERTKRDSLPLTKEEWQTLKTAVLAQQTNNKPRAKSCRVCVGIRKGGPVYFTYCPGCGRYLGDKTSPVG